MNPFLFSFIDVIIISYTITSISVNYSAEISEEAIRRYLMRKPMTAKELVLKFASKTKQKMTREQLTQRIGQLLKKIGPDRKQVNNVLYLSLKKTEWKERWKNWWKFLKVESGAIVCWR